jgi:hypothetical protein
MKFSDEDAKRVREHAQDRIRYYTNGEYAYTFKPTNGMYTAQGLRIILEEVEAMNKAWAEVQTEEIA